MGLVALGMAPSSFQTRPQGLLYRPVRKEPQRISSASTILNPLLSLSERRPYLSAEFTVLFSLLTKPCRMILISRHTNNSSEELCHRCKQKQSTLGLKEALGEKILSVCITEDRGVEARNTLSSPPFCMIWVTTPWLDDTLEDATTPFSAFARGIFGEALKVGRVHIWFVNESRCLALT